MQKHPIERAAGTIVARCVRVPVHKVELTIVPENVSGGIRLSARCACCATTGFLNAVDVLRLVDQRQPIEYDQFVLTME